MKRRLRARLLILAVCPCLVASGIVLGAAPQLRFERAASGYGVSVRLDGRTVLSSPAEGLWSIATGWEDGWPADWIHAGPAELRRQGEWTILTGELNTPSGRWLLRDAYRVEGDLVKCVRRFTWQGTDTATHTTLSVRFQCPGKGPGVLLPGVLYHGNPSGARSGRVPVYEGRPGEVAFFEEHRFPMPYASIEWAGPAGRTGAALHSLPSPVPFGNRPDQWWSLGVAAGEDGTELALLSGPCASNGRKSVIKATQSGFLPYDNAHLNVPPGAIIEKTFHLQVYEVESEGSGFQHPTRASMRLFAPFAVDGMPTFAEIIRSKYEFARTRWHETGTVAGFKKYPDHNIFVLGWCGQAAACGYAFQVLADELNDPDAWRMVQKSLDFVATTEFHEQGFCTWYRADEERWVRGGNPELLSQGQAMLNVANAVRVGRRSNLDVTRWEAFLRRAGDFHARRILSETWNPLSTDQAFFIAPLCEAYRLFGVEAYREAALKAGEVYAARHVNMREPYWGGTLDASCEDKEGAFAALQGFLALYELTGRREHLLWAAHAGDVALTYLVVWDIDLPPGRLRDHNFKTRGWTAVSVQNQHIDVFGVLIAPDIYRLGRHLERDDLKKAALLMVRSCGQLIDPFGSQGEQPHQTNYAQHGDFRRQLEAGDITGVRGNYVEQWTVFWITAHFLNAAAQFKELGVPVWTDDSAALPPEDQPAEDQPAVSAPLQEGAIGIMLGSWDTQVEFDDLKVVSADKVLVRDLFDVRQPGWQSVAGQWEVSEGVYRQTSAAMPALTAHAFPAPAAGHTLSVRARKTGGSEGFLVAFDLQDARNHLWLNLGGWNNTVHRLEQTIDGDRLAVGPAVRGSIETGRWYDIEIRVAGRRFECFLDGRQIIDWTDAGFDDGELPPDNDRLNFGQALIPDLMADPSVVDIDGTFYCYATTDGWGEGLATSGTPVVWTSKDFLNWSFEGSSFPADFDLKYWAPSSLVHRNGRYHSFPTLDGKITAVVADSPTGPFLAPDGRPVTLATHRPYPIEQRHSIDAEVFIDDDGQGYMYWQGHRAVRLKPDLLSPDGPVIRIPVKRDGYSEGPFLFKRHGIYYYLYTLQGHELYSYAYTMSRVSPLGPWETPGQDLIAVSDPEARIFGPGHGCFFSPTDSEQWYFVYLEYGRGGTTRQIYADRMNFNPDGTIQPVKLTKTGVGALRPVADSSPNLALHATATASSTRRNYRVRPRSYPELDRVETYAPANAIDGSNGTRWLAARTDRTAWFQVDLGAPHPIRRTEACFVKPTAGHAYRLETSVDGLAWEAYGGQEEVTLRSPHRDEKAVRARYLKLTILEGEPGLWEFRVY